MSRVIVVGGGPAGMMAAISASSCGHQVTLLERNEKLGKKLYITGKGRCNLTNVCDRDAFLANLPRNGRFMFSAWSQMDCRRLMDFFEKNGVPLVTERGNRVFPESQKSSDIIRALTNQLIRAGVEVRLGSRVRSLSVEEDRIRGVMLENGDLLTADHVILATGGLAYPLTGSTGDGYAMAERLGHGVIKCRPSLVPLVTSDKWLPDLQGLSLKNVELTAKNGKKQLYKELGEMMFTHFGITGPLVLTLSALLPDDLSKLSVMLDLKPGLSIEKLDQRILRDFEAYHQRVLENAMADLLPHRLIPVVIQQAGLSPRQSLHQLTAAQRRALAEIMKALPLHVSGSRDYDEAVITRGGVEIKGIDPTTMRSKLVKGLSLAGELLDVDGFTGGFNLQIAFSTGYVAGQHVDEEA